LRKDLPHMPQFRRQQHPLQRLLQLRQPLHPRRWLLQPSPHQQQPRRQCLPQQQPLLQRAPPLRRDPLHPASGRKCPRALLVQHDVPCSNGTASAVGGWMPKACAAAALPGWSWTTATLPAKVAAPSPRIYECSAGLTTALLPNAPTAVRTSSGPSAHANVPRRRNGRASDSAAPASVSIQPSSSGGLAGGFDGHDLWRLPDDARWLTSRGCAHSASVDSESGFWRAARRHCQGPAQHPHSPRIRAARTNSVPTAPGSVPERQVRLSGASNVRLR
jgi:hypothetical protein